MINNEIIYYTNDDKENIFDMEIGDVFINKHNHSRFLRYKNCFVF